MFYIELTAPMNQDKGEVCVKGRVNPGQQGSAVLITGFYQWLVNLSPSSLLMTDKISVKNVPWKPHIETIDNFFKKKYQDIRGHVSWKGDMETKKETNKPEMQRYASELPPYPREREMVKLIRAQGGCLGTKSRWKTW